MTPPVIMGGIYLVRDDRVRLVPVEERKLHRSRPVMVVSGPETNPDPDWQFVLVCPLSTATSFRTRFCVKVAAGEGGVDRKTWVRVPAVQPMEKDHLGDHSGVVPAGCLQEVQVRLAEYLGLLDENGYDADEVPF